MQHPYYPEYKYRTEDAYLENSFGAWVHLFLLHMALIVPFALVYFLILRTLPVPIKATYLIHLCSLILSCLMKATSLSRSPAAKESSPEISILKTILAEVSLLDQKSSLSFGIHKRVHITIHELELF